MVSLYLFFTACYRINFGGNASSIFPFKEHLPMSSIGLNKWIVSGNLAADMQVKTVELRNGETARVANGTLYVPKTRKRDESFTVSLSIWERSAAWRKLSFLKKGSLIICTGTVEPNPYTASNDQTPRAGLEMTVLDVDLDIVRGQGEDSASGAIASEPVTVG
jgi:single-strand DNA-binding protein